MSIDNPTRKAESGLLLFDGSHISYISDDYGRFSVPLHDVAVVGEFTTSEGPFIDDWFLVFVPRSGDRWFAASVYADGTSELLAHLSTILGCALPLALANSARRANRIIWPAALADRPLLTSAHRSCSLSVDALSAAERNV